MCLGNSTSTIENKSARALSGEGGCSVENPNVIPFLFQVLLQPPEDTTELASQGEIHAQGILLAVRARVVSVHDVVTLGRVGLRSLFVCLASPCCSAIGDRVVAVGVEDLPERTGAPWRSSAVCCWRLSDNASCSLATLSI